MSKSGLNEKKWPSNFFSGANLISSDKEIAEMSWDEDVLPWKELAENGNTNTPLCLPFVVSENEVHWYFCANEQQGSGAIREEINSFLGNSYSQFTGQGIVLDEEIIQEKEIADNYVSPVYRISATNRTQIIEIRNKIRLYQRIVRKRPQLSHKFARPFSHIRRDFDLSLIANNEKNARLFLEEMKKTGRLTQQNLLFLEIRLLAGLGYWHQIVLEETLLLDLVNHHLPPSVVDDIAKAYFWTFIRPFEQDGNLEECLLGLENNGFKRLGKIFANRYGINNTSVLKSFLFYDILSSNQTSHYTKELLEKICESENNALLNQVSKYICEKFPENTSAEDVGFIVTSSDLKLAIEAFDDGKYDKATTLLKKIEPNVETISYYLTCDHEEDDDKLKEIIVNFFENLSPEETDLIDEKILRKIQRVEREIRGNSTKSDSASDISQGWLEWASYVVQSSDQEVCEKIFQRNSHKWNSSALSKKKNQVEKLANIIENSSDRAANIFRKHFADIFKAFVTDVNESNQNVASILKTLLLLLSMSDRISSDELNIILDLTDSILDLGLTSDEYDDLIEQLILVSQAQFSISTLDWALDLTEMVASHRCPNNEARLRFAVSMFDNFSAFSHRLTRNQKILISLLCKDYQITTSPELEQEEQENTEEDTISNKLAALKVAIYTLTEQAGFRAKTIIEGISPSCEVILNHDKECTERLRSLAKSADLFVFAWKSSKHQAFYCIKNNRSTDKPVLQPVGKGSSSIINELINFLD